VAQFLSLVLAGAVSGGLYAVMASGLVLTYQASGVFNVGHGAVAFATALVFYVLHQPAAEGGAGLAVVPAAIISVGLFAPLLGWFLDRFLFRRLAGAPEATRLVGAVGVLIALPAAALLTIAASNAFLGTDLPTASGEQGIQPPGLGPWPARSFSLTRGVAIDSDQIAVLAAAALAAVGLWYLLRRTRLGLETRAAVDRGVLARLRGVDTDRASMLVWMVTTFLAGLAGVLIAPLFDLSAITFHMIVFTSFTAVVAARLRSVPGAFAAGIALGVVQNLVNGYAPDLLTEISGFRSSVPFLLLFVLLFLVPTRGRDAGSVAEEAPPIDPAGDLPAWRRRLPWAVAAAVFCAYGLWIADAYWTGILNRGLVMALVLLSFVVVTGLGGMISLAQATFVTVGGFTTGWLVTHQWPSTVPILMDNGRVTFWLAVLGATVLTMAVGVLVALPSLRFGGLMLALATLALAFAGDRLVFQLEGVRNGSSGWSIPRPAYGPVDLADDRTLFVVLVAMVALAVALVVNLNRSATGRAVLALRSSAVAAATSGVAPTRVKLTVFAASAGLAGFAGAFFALVNSPMTNTSAPALVGIVWLAVAVTFGIRRPAGAVVAGVVYAMVPPWLSGIGVSWGAPWSSLPGSVREVVANPDLPVMLFGLGALSLARQPDGVLADVGAALARRRAARRARPAAEPTEAVAPAGTAGPVVPVPVEPVPVEPALMPSAPRGAGPDGSGAAVAAEAGAVLELRGVYAGYGEVEVLHGVSLSVAPGEVVAVLGANGAGKSTLCAVAAGLVAPSRGEVVLSGRDVTSEPPFRRARTGLLLAPEARGVFPGLSVDDNLALRLRSAEQRRAARGRFPILGDRHDQLAGLLSGGEQQQLALAVALGDPPAVFIADEPTLGLAPLAVEAVVEALAELRDRGSAVVLVEEQAATALRLADTVVVMELGRVAWRGPVSEVDATRLAATYLGEADLVGRGPGARSGDEEADGEISEEPTR